MQLFLLGFSLIFLWLNWSQSKDILNPGILFNLMWSVVSLLYIVDYGNLYPVTIAAYSIIFVGLIVFNIPILLLNVKYRRSIRRHSLIRFSRTIAIRRPIILVFFQLFIIAMMIPFMLKLAAVAAGAGLSTARTMLATNEGNLMSFWERWIYIYLLVYPGINVQMLIAAFLLTKSQLKLSYKVFSCLLALVAVGLRVASDGGRMVIMDTVLCLLFSISFSLVSLSNSFSKMNRKAQKRLRKVFVGIILLFIVLIVIVTFYRSAGGVSPIEYAFKMVSYYFTIGPRLLDKAIQSPRMFGLDTMHLGGVSIGGAWEYLQKLLAMIGVEIPSFFGIAQQEMGQAYSVGEGIRLNAFPTMYYYFMKDWSYLGILIGPVLFSMIAFFSYLRMHRSYRITYLVIYYLVLIGIVYSPCWWPFYRVEYFSIFLLYLLLSKLVDIRWIPKK